MTRRQERRPRTRRRTPPASSRPALDDFAELFEETNDIVLVNDREGRIVAANRMAREFGGYTADDVRRGVHLQDILPPDDYAAAMLLTQRALDGETIPEVYERAVVLRDGSQRVLELRSSVWRRHGAPPLLQTIGRDVSERHAAAAFQSGLQEVSQALLTVQSLDELGRVICDAARRVLRVDGAYLWLRRGDDLVCCAAAGHDAARFAGIRRPLDDVVLGQIYRSPDVLVIHDFAHSLYHQPHVTPGVQAMLAVPLRRSDPPVGALVFTDNTNPRRFTTALRAHALIFGAQTTVAIESALSREREEEEGRVSAALLHVTRATRELLAEEDVLREMVRSAREELGCDWTLVTLWDANARALRVAVTAGWTPEAAEELRLIELRPDVIPELAPLLQHQPIEVREPPPAAAALYQRWRMSSFRATPMVRANRLCGTFVIGYGTRRGPFSPRECRIADGIAAQAAVAVENARLVDDLRRANQLKSEFLGAMSHELRTPLNAILGYAQLLSDGLVGSISDEQRDAVERILVNGYGLLDLISTTLDANRLEAGRVTVQLASFTLDHLLTELQHEFSLRVRDGVTLTWPQVADVPELRTDPGKLKAVVRNLVDNALKFTEHGSITVRADYVREFDRLRISVQDTGRGIPGSALPTIFEMFQQVGGVPSSGVGLGLYVVRRYAEVLGGKVGVESLVGRGSTFTIDIPRALPGAS